MKLKIASLIAVTLIILVISNLSQLRLVNRYYLNPCYYDEPVKQQDFPQVFLDIEKYYSDIGAYASPLIKIDTLDYISYKGAQYPILEVKIGSQSAPKRLLILAGVHGNESGGTLAIIKFLEDILADPSKYEEWDVKIITPLNPAGTITMSRYNEHGCDLNRKVESSTQKGIVVQRDIIASFEPEIVVTLHEAPCEGFLIHPGKYLSSDLVEKLLNDVTAKGIVLSTEDYLGRELPTPGVSAVKGGLKFLKNMARVETLGDYLLQKVAGILMIPFKE